MNSSTTFEDDEPQSFDSFMKDIQQSLSSLVKESIRAPENLYEEWQAFSAAIRWDESIFKMFLALHISLILIFILTRRNFTVQIVLFLFCCCLIVLSEPLNTWAGQRWETITTQNYFDKSGAFMGIFFSAPLLFVVFMQLVNFLWMASSDLIKVKRLQLKRKEKEVKRNDPKND